MAKCTECDNDLTEAEIAENVDLCFGCENHLNDEDEDFEDDEEE